MFEVEAGTRFPEIGRNEIRQFIADGIATHTIVAIQGNNNSLLLSAVNNFEGLKAQYANKFAVA